MAKGFVRSIVEKIDVNTLERSKSEDLELNAIAEVVVETTHPLAFDPYSTNKSTGRFLLVDPITNQSSGAGMIIAATQTAHCPQGDSVAIRLSTLENRVAELEKIIAQLRKI